MAGINVQHVPYKGATPALTDLIAGRIAFTIDSFTMQLPHVKTGKLRAAGRHGRDEGGRGARGTDGRRVRSRRLRVSLLDGHRCASRYAEGDCRAAERRFGTRAETAEAREWFAMQGADVVGDAPEEFGSVIRADYVRWGQIIREAGIKAE
jgi:tripartite-type tricarboxylate transporter receptor subunit TctC